MEGNRESNAIEKERKRERKKEYDAENPCIRVKIRKDSGVVDALNKACCALHVAKTNMSEGLFVKEWRKIGMRDMQKKQISDKRYSDKTYDAIAYRVPSSSSEYQQFEEEVSISAETKATYVRNALVRKLTKDGFLPPKAE